MYNVIILYLVDWSFSFKKQQKVIDSIPLYKDIYWVSLCAYNISGAEI